VKTSNLATKEEAGMIQVTGIKWHGSHRYLLNASFLHSCVFNHEDGRNKVLHRNLITALTFNIDDMTDSQSLGTSACPVNNNLYDCSHLIGIFRGCFLYISYFIILYFIFNLYFIYIFDSLK
jgi:hypothetical protein